MTKKSKEVNYKQASEALAKDLVEMSQIVRKVLSNSTFNFNVLDDVKLLEMMTKQTLELYIQEENVKKA